MQAYWKSIFWRKEDSTRELLIKLVRIGDSLQPLFSYNSAFKLSSFLGIYLSAVVELGSGTLEIRWLRISPSTAIRKYICWIVL